MQPENITTLEELVRYADLNFTDVDVELHRSKEDAIIASATINDRGRIPDDEWENRPRLFFEVAGNDVSPADQPGDNELMDSTMVSEPVDSSGEVVNEG